MEIIVPGYGKFYVPVEKLPELVNWLQNNGVKVEQNTQQWDGRTLLTD